MIDIDFFKQYNDNYGHVQGDTILKSVADIITQSIHRATDFVARYGGEEFVVLLPNTPIESAIQISKRLTANLRLIGIEHAFSEISDFLTLSIGISSTEVDSIDLVNLADKALYKAKKMGRNKIEVYTKK
jgi:diguanylate cyclase (GGDEF)-like protein